MKTSKLRSATFSPLAAAAIAALVHISTPSAHAVVYYWDNNGTSSGFGSPATGTWSSSGSTLWNNDTTGGSAGAPNTLGTSVTTSSSDTVNFGNGAAGLGAGTINVSGTVQVGGGNSTGITFASGSGAIVLSGGTINLNAASTAITVNNTSDTISSIISGATSNLFMVGTGKLTLTNDNTFSGVLRVSSGTVSVGSIGNSGANSPLGTNLTIALGVSSTAGTLEYTGGGTTTDKQIRIGNGTAAQVGGATIYNNGNGALIFGNANFNVQSGTTASVVNRTLTLGGTYSAGINEIQGAIANPTSSFTTALTVDGSIWKLSGTNTYTGGTSVSAGTLLVDNSTGSGTGAGAVTVAAGTLTGTPVAKLGGKGAIAGSVSLAAESASGFKNGGVLAPTAAASGTALDVTGTTTFGTGSIFEWNMSAANPAADPGNNVANSGSYGQLAGTGAIGGSGAIFNIVLGAGNTFADAFWNSNKTWNNVFSGSGASTNLTSIFASFGGSSVSSTGVVSGQGQFSFTGTQTLNWTAVPEPSTALGGLLLTAGLLRRRRHATA